MDNTEFSSTENLCGNSGGGSEKVGGMCSNPLPPPAPTPAAASSTTTANVPLELHVCMGLNACKGHDRFGTNECAGTGFCSTAEIHHCRTLNNCRGQGGCGLFGTAEDDATPGANECAWQGACAVPIQAERFSTQGENKGKSVWVLARRLFEERMKKARRSFGPSPYKCGPPQAWLIQSLGKYDSCGSAGNKYCTFGFNNPAKDAQELCEKSQPHVLCGGPKPQPADCSAKADCSAQSVASHCNTPKESDAVHCATAKESDESVHCATPADANACGADKSSDANKCSVDITSDANKCSVDKSSDANKCGVDKSSDTNHCSSAAENKCGDPNVDSEQTSEKSSDDTQ